MFKTLKEGKVRRFAGDAIYFHSAASKVSDSYKNVVKHSTLNHGNKSFSQNVVFLLMQKAN